jgi:hypothetical protein
VNEIERQAMEFLLRGDHPVLAVLRDQAALAHVAKRNFTGVGFFTHFDLRSTAARLSSRRRIVIGDVSADVARVQHGAGFLLFVEDGLIDMLECFTYDDAWPTDATLTRLYYHRPKHGDGGAVVETTDRDLERALRDVARE